MPDHARTSQLLLPLAFSLVAAGLALGFSGLSGGDDALSRRGVSLARALAHGGGAGVAPDALADARRLGDDVAYVAVLDGALVEQAVWTRDEGRAVPAHLRTRSGSDAPRVQWTDDGARGLDVIAPYDGGYVQLGLDAPKAALALPLGLGGAGLLLGAAAAALGRRRERAPLPDPELAGEPFEPEATGIVLVAGEEDMFEVPDFGQPIAAIEAPEAELDDISDAQAPAVLLEESADERLVDESPGDAAPAGVSFFLMEEPADEGHDASAQASSAPRTAVHAGVLDAGTLTSIRLLESQGQDGLLLRVTAEFEARTATQLRSVRQAFVHGEAAGVSAAARRLMGCAGNVGAMKLVALSKGVRRQSDAGDLSGLGRSLKALEIGVKEARAALREELGEAAEALDGDEPAPVSLGGRAVLVISASGSRRKRLTRSLAAAGAEVSSHASGLDGLAALQRRLPDLLVIDAEAGDIDGYEVCSALRALPGGARVPALFVLADGDWRGARRAFVAGATDFIAKPVDTDELRLRARFLLRGSAPLAMLRRGHGHLARAQSIVGLGDWTLDLNTSLLRVSEEATALLGLDIERPPMALDQLRAMIRPRDRERVEQAVGALLTNQEPMDLWYQVATDGGWRTVWERARVFRDDDGLSAALMGTLQDVTDRAVAEARRALSFRDDASGLLNRAGFVEATRDAAERSSVLSTGLAVAVIGLERPTGARTAPAARAVSWETLLAEAGARLQEALVTLADVERRQGGVGECSLARFGAHTFALLLSDLSEAAAVDRIVTGLLDALEANLQARAGVSRLPDPSADAASLLRDAEAALHLALGEDARLLVYTPELGGASLAVALRDALSRGELAVHYQPRLETTAGGVVGSEALVRWNHPERGELAASEFLKLAEETGLIVSIGEWVLREACRQYRSWQEAGLNVGRVSVNLSTAQFYAPDLAGIIRAALEESELSASSLELEFTEDVVLKDVTAALEVMRQLKSLGVSLAMDAFGAGRASLNTLRLFPLDTLKVDRTFIAGLGVDTEDTMVTSVVISLGKALQLNVVAAGVEEDSQRRVLKQWSCDALQGYLFSPPICSQDFERYVQS